MFSIFEKACFRNAEMDGWTDRGKTICPFHHSSNGRGIKRFQNLLAGPKETIR